jgi:preprotein translocase subunit YajC
MIQLFLAQQSGSPQAGTFGLFYIGLIVLIFYFLLFRPMRKRQKNLERLITELKNGDRVITTGGVYGTVTGVKDHTFIVRIADHTKIEVAKNAIAALQAPPSGKSD